MDIRHILLTLILLAPIVHSACQTGYSDSFDVRTLDAKYRVIPSASVRVTFDRGTAAGDVYFTTPWRETDSSGIYHFVITSQGTSNRQIDCNIFIEAKVNGVQISKLVEESVHGSTIDMQFGNVYPVRFYVRDQRNNPLINASVTMGNNSLKTDSQGMASAYFGSGNYDYLVSYLEGTKAGILSVQDDVNFQILIPNYAVTFEVADDYGQPINATLSMHNQTYNVRDGHLNISPVFGERIPYTIEYSGLVKSDDLVPGQHPDVRIYFDRHAPVFGEIRTEQVNDKLRMTLPVSDEGDFASGIDPKSFTMTYRVDPGDITANWQKPSTYSAGRNLFVAEFPNLPPGKIVQFKAEVADHEGNRARIEGRFSTLSPTLPDQNNTSQNTTGGTSGTSGEQGIPLLYTIGGAIALFLVVYALFRTISRPKNGA